ncbi:ribonuclease H-like domain-containing protein [Tanacetum coccineum]
MNDVLTRNIPNPTWYTFVVRQTGTATAKHKGDGGAFFCLVTKGGDRGACKLLGDVIEVLGCLLEGNPQKEDQGYVDSGCLRHMTWNMSYISDFKEFDKGYVTFGGGAKGGKITADESHVLLKVPRKNNMYSIDMKNIVPKESLTCLVAKATLDESMLWHRRLGHVNDQTCVACLKGK